MVNEINPMLAHWHRKVEYANIVYMALASHHACQDARMKKLVSTASNRLIGSTKLDDLKKADKVIVNSKLQFLKGLVHVHVLINTPCFENR